MNKYKSTAMWSIYIRNNGVAIKSTYKRLVGCFKDTNEEINIGIVEYLVMELDKISSHNVFTLALRKRNIYEFEGELRAIYLSDKTISISKG